jgi:tetratricopeptide (TPR) repeat protein
MVPGRFFPAPRIILEGLMLSASVRRSLAAILVMSLVCAARAQRGNGDPSRAGGPVDLPSASAPISEPNTNPRAVFIAGKVVIAGGGVTADHILIERVCNGLVRREGYTDSQGEFQFELGRNQQARDASQDDSDRMVATRGARVNMEGRSQIRFDNCDLRASLSGFVSTSVSMRVESETSIVRVPAITLTRIGGVEGATVSLTSMAAPKEARSAFEKGRKAGMEKKFELAARELNKAVGIYPQYAVAWSLLGEIHRLQNQFETAKKEYAQALAADAKFVNPYFGLAAMAIVESRWADAAQLTDQLIALNAFAYPMAYFFNAAANYNLGKLDAAEQSARKFLQVDAAHTRPDIALLLGNILARKHQYAEAAQLYRDFLALRPDVPNAELVRKEAERLEGLSAAKQ